MSAPDSGLGSRAIALAGLIALSVLGCKDDPPPADPVPSLAAVDQDGPPTTSDCHSWDEFDYASLPALPEAPHMAAFDQIWRTVAQKHYDPTLACLDWPALRATYAERVLAAGEDASAAYEAINELLGLLGQSHLHATAPTSHADAAARQGGPAIVPIRVRWIPRKSGDETRAAIVVDAAVGGHSSSIPAGAELLAVEGESITERATELAKQVEARGGRPTEAAFLIAQMIGSLLSCPEGATKALRVRELRDGGAEAEPVEREAPCVLPEGERISLGNLRNLPTVVRHRMIGDPVPSSDAASPDTPEPEPNPSAGPSEASTIGYLAFNYWMLPMTERVRAGVTELRERGMQALIIDLRGNPGGVGAMSIPIARMFVPEGTSLGRLQMREFNQEFKVEPNPNAFDGPIAILIDEGTASTSEIFALGMRDIGRITLVGAGPSAGMALPSMIESLPDGGLIQYVVGDYHSAKGTAAEGEGIAPDVRVDEHGSEYAAGRDPVLEAAVEHLAKLVDPPSPAPVR